MYDLFWRDGLNIRAMSNQVWPEITDRMLLHKTYEPIDRVIHKHAEVA